MFVHQIFVVFDRRAQHAEAPAPTREAGEGFANGQASRCGGRDDRVDHLEVGDICRVRGRVMLARLVDEQFLDRHRLHHGKKSVQVIRVRVRRHDQVDGVLIIVVANVVNNVITNRGVAGIDDNDARGSVR
jgi:ribosomal protein L31E